MSEMVRNYTHLCVGGHGDAYKKYIYVAFLGAALFATGCGEDSSSNNNNDDSSEVTCHEHEIKSGETCICDNENKYYGEVGACKLCEGDHKVVKQNKCDCDTGYKDNGQGVCQQGCGTGEVESGGACICDNNSQYYGNAGACKLCEGDHKVVKQNKCDCDTGYKDNGQGVCQPDCGTGEVESGGACICDNNSQYYGEVGSCNLCEGDHKVVKQNKCDCDTGYKDNGQGVCQPDCGTGEIESGGACICDNNSQYYGNVGACKLCEGDHKVVKQNKCDCDTGYKDNGQGVCQLDCGTGEIESGGTCVCDVDNYYFGTPGNCELCEVDNRFRKSCFKQVGDVVKIGSYVQWPEVGSSGLVPKKDELEWIVLKMNTTDRRLYLVSKYVIDAQVYDPNASNQSMVSWENSSIRSWLNNEFFNTAFTAEEKASIVKTYAAYRTDGRLQEPDYHEVTTGSGVVDDVVLLTEENVELLHDLFPMNNYPGSTVYTKESGPCSEEELPSSIQAIQNMVNRCAENWKESEYGCRYTWSYYCSLGWWLRCTIGGSGVRKACFMEKKSGGFYDINYNIPVTEIGGVRPALWVKY